MLNLKDFLESNQESITYKRHETDDMKSLLKIFNSTKEIVYIFKNNYPKSSEVNPFYIKDFHFLGLYDSINKKFYFQDSYELALFENNHKYSFIDISGLEYSTVEELLLEINNAVNDKIIEKIDNDETKLNVNLDEIRIDEDWAKSKAKRKFFECKEVDINSYASFKMNINSYFDDLLEYLKNKKITIEKLASSFIENNKNNIYTEIIENKIKENHIKTISNDERYIMVKNINKVLLNRNLKTLNIKYKQDENEMTFKIDNTGCYLDSISDKIYAHKIISPKDRELFEKTFETEENYSGDILPKYIAEITHSRNVYYKNDNIG